MTLEAHKPTSLRGAKQFRYSDFEKMNIGSARRKSDRYRTAEKFGYGWLVFLLASHACLAEQPLDFYDDIVPVLTKAGCNSGACHGAAVGRGGFPLSLYGGDPKFDYDSIVKDLEGRRVNLFEADRSLFFLKPTESIAHGGGYRLDPDEAGAKLLVEWIRQGAVDRDTRELESLSITPTTHVTDELNTSVPLRAVATYTDGTVRDVTRWTVFSAEDSSAVEIDPDTADSKLLRRGRHIVIARYLEHVSAMELIVRLSGEEVDLQSAPEQNFVDRHINELLETLALPVSAQIGDGDFLRRITLDLTGRLPTPEETLAYLGNNDPRRRQQLVNRLLMSPEFDDYWTLQLAKLFRVQARPQESAGAEAYHTWIRRQVTSDAAYDQMARSLILASGDTEEFGPANFYRTVAGPREQAEFMSELFLANRLRCANCHNHPLDRWTQDDYHGLAAIFAKVESGKIVRVKSEGSVIHPKTGEDAFPRIPGERFVRAEDGRMELADWLTHESNPYFAKAIVNRLWKALMGRGLVEPADDMRATNPPTHPALLDELASDFVAHGYRLRHTLEVIVSSAAYARSAHAVPENKADDRFYSHALRKPLEAEVLADAISDILGVADQYGEEPAGTRAIALVDAKTPSTTLDILGRCSREESCETSSEAGGGLTLKLHLMNGDLLNARIGNPDSRLSRLIASGESPMEVIREFYLAAFSRFPSREEADFWQAQLKNLDSSQQQRELLEDFVWSLLSSNDFVTNH